MVRRVLELILGIWATVVFVITCLNDSLYTAWTADTGNVRNPPARRVAGVAAGLLLLALLTLAILRIRRGGRTERRLFYAVVTIGVLGWPILYIFLPNQYTV